MFFQMDAHLENIVRDHQHQVESDELCPKFYITNEAVHSAAAEIDKGDINDSRKTTAGNDIPEGLSMENLLDCQDNELSSPQEVIISNTAQYYQEHPNTQIVSAFLWIEAKLCAQLKILTFCEKVSYIYNPLEYASDPHAHYVSKYCGTKAVLFLGMNPGPFGMAQNGIPFGDTKYVCDWLNISGKVNSPEQEHPKRPIAGFSCPRSEVSGARFWGMMSSLCGTPEKFFQHCFVHNYCPLVFIGNTGKNIIPSSLPAQERKRLEAVCDVALLECIQLLRVQVVVGVGKYAADRAAHVLRSSDDVTLANIRVKRILHPSPASPQANKGWVEVASRQLRECGVLQLLTRS